MTSTPHASNPSHSAVKDDPFAPAQAPETDEAPQEVLPEPVLLDTPRDGVPEVVTTDPGLRRAARVRAAG